MSISVAIVDSQNKPISPDGMPMGNRVHYCLPKSAGHKLHIVSQQLVQLDRVVRNGQRVYLETEKVSSDAPINVPLTLTSRRAIYEIFTEGAKAPEVMLIIANQGYDPYGDVAK